MSESFSTTCASALPPPVSPLLYSATRCEHDLHLWVLLCCRVPLWYPNCPNCPPPLFHAATDRPFRQNEVQREPRSPVSVRCSIFLTPGIRPPLLSSLPAPDADALLFLLTFLPPSHDDKTLPPSPPSATMPTVFASVFLRERASSDAHDNFPSKQLFILGTSSRSHPKMVCSPEIYVS